MIRRTLSNAPPNMSPITLVTMAFTRWHVEHSFRVAKSEIGFMDYEGRRYDGLIRHLTLCMLAMLFIAEQTADKAPFPPELTLEQMASALNVICDEWLKRKRHQESDAGFAARRINYHQERNAAAKRSRQTRLQLE